MSWTAATMLLVHLKSFTQVTLGFRVQGLGFKELAKEDSMGLNTA